MISYPLTFPTVKAPRSFAIRAGAVVGVQPSPLTLEHTVYVWPGDGWELDIEFPPLNGRAEAAAVIAFLLKLNGMEGTFLAGDPLNTSPRGTWAGASPLVVGAHVAGVKTVAIDGLAAGATGKEMDWIQFGSGSTARLHQVVQDFTANGSGEATLEIWPRTRAALADNAPITLASPQGLWRLASNTTGWSVGLAQRYGVRFTCIEARDG